MVTLSSGWLDVTSERGGFVGAGFVGVVARVGHSTFRRGSSRFPCSAVEGRFRFRSQSLAKSGEVLAAWFGCLSLRREMSESHSTRRASSGRNVRNGRQARKPSAVAESLASRADKAASGRSADEARMCKSLMDEVWQAVGPGFDYRGLFEALDLHFVTDILKVANSICWPVGKAPLPQTRVKTFMTAVLALMSVRGLEPPKSKGREVLKVSEGQSVTNMADVLV